MAKENQSILRPNGKSQKVKQTLYSEAEWENMKLPGKTLERTCFRPVTVGMGGMGVARNEEEKINKVRSYSYNGVTITTEWDDYYNEEYGMEFPKGVKMGDSLIEKVNVTVDDIQNIVDFLREHGIQIK